MSKKKELYYEEKIIKMPLYPGQLVLVATNDVEKIHKKTKCGNEDEIYAFCIRAYYKDYLSYFIVIDVKHENLNKKNKEIKLASIIAHESLHVVNKLFTMIGTKHDTQNDEPASYLIGWVVKKCTKFYNKK